MKLEILNRAIMRAYLNWYEWSAVWNGKIRVFDDENLFKAFVSQYGVLRGENATNREKLRVHLSNLFSTNKVNLRNACAVVTLAGQWLQDGIVERNHISLATKIAAFHVPAKFIAMDRFNKRGIILLHETARNSVKITHYEDFMRHVLNILRQHASRITKAAESAGIEHRLATSSAFNLRVVDNYLMDIGGRWPQR
jgi:hypothetical protein